MDEFEKTDLGLMHYFLGIEVVQSSEEIFISQKQYVEDLDRFQMVVCNPANTPTEYGLKLHTDHGGKKVDNTIQTNCSQFDVSNCNMNQRVFSELNQQVYVESYSDASLGC